MEKKQKKKYAKFIVIGIFIMIFSMSLVFNNSISTYIKTRLQRAGVQTCKTDMVVHFIQVGQGDAIALRFPNDEVMLIDAGPKDSQNQLITYLKNNIFQSSQDLNIEYLVLTHSDLDHSGGISAVFGEFDVKNFYRPNIASASEDINDYALKSEAKEYDAAINMAKDENGLTTQVINKNFEFNVGDASVKILAPLDVYSTTNAMSCVIKISYKEKSFLFTGDINIDSESDMINYYKEELDADVLKVAHHGSKTSTSEEFIDIVSPEYAVICVGENSYGHPHFTTISKLENNNAIVLTTLNDSVRISCGTEGLSVLSSDKIISYEFWQWKIIVLFVDIVLIGIVIKDIFVIIKLKKSNKKVSKNV